MKRYDFRNLGRENRRYERLAGVLAREGARKADEPNDAPTPNADRIAARDQYTAGLRALADWLDAHPLVPMPMTTALYAPAVNTPTLACYARNGGMDTATDDDAKTMSAFKAFGPVLYEAFTYLPGHPSLVQDPGPEPF
jgi:hypothetical protein